MKVQGSVKPTSLFTIEKQPKHSDFCLVRFYENAVEIENVWEYDEYHLELKATANLTIDIENNFSNYLQAAKATEPIDEIAILKDADTMLEDVLCDLDIEYDARITATEDAICELDMMLNGG